MLSAFADYERRIGGATIDMKVQEDSNLGDWFDEWYKNLQSKAPEVPESAGWVLSALDLMNKMVSRIQQLEG